MTKPTDMIGPMGPKGCSTMTCRRMAASEYLYEITHPFQGTHEVLYRWCAEHDRLLDTDIYPNFILKEHRAL